MMAQKQWSVAGLCVTAKPDELERVEATLGARPELEVYARDPQHGKLVVVQECSTIRDHRRNLEQIQALPGVLTADLVVHYDDETCGYELRTTGGER